MNAFDASEEGTRKLGRILRESRHGHGCGPSVRDESLVAIAPKAFRPAPFGIVEKRS